MKTSSSLVVILTLIVVSTGTIGASDDIVVKREAAEKFAELPDNVRFPEGITANPQNGDIYVGTFDTGPNSNKLLRFTKNGKLVAQRDFGGDPLLGLEFNPRDNKVYICNVGVFAGTGSKIQRIAADFDDTTPIENVAFIPIIGAPPNPLLVDNPDGSQDTIFFGNNNVPVPNALAFNDNNLFVSDSFQGAIFLIANAQACSETTPCTPTTVKHDGLLATAGVPPFGANGLALSRDKKHLFIANTGDDRVLKLTLETNELSVFAQSINGADGIAFDGDDHLIVAANQADEIVILNKNGRVIAKLGDFLGIRNDGSPRGLLFPASVVIVKDKIFVTNLALPLTPTVGDEPEDDVTKWTISRIDIPKKLP